MINIPDEVKELLTQSGVKKNLRIKFLDREHADITSNNVLDDSFKWTSTVGSGSELKLGLSEAPMIEFETFDVGNIKGAKIDCSIEIFCSQTVSGAVYKSDIEAYVYSIPLGIYTVESCRKEENKKFRKVVAYNDQALSMWKIPDFEKKLYSAPFGDNTFNVNICDFVAINTNQADPDIYEKSDLITPTVIGEPAIQITKQTSVGVTETLIYTFRAYSITVSNNTPIIQLHHGYTLEDKSEWDRYMGESRFRLHLVPRYYYVTKRATKYHTIYSSEMFPQRQLADITYSEVGKILNEDINSERLYDESSLFNIPYKSKTISSTAWNFNTSYVFLVPIRYTRMRSSSGVIEEIEFEDKFIGYYTYARADDGLYLPKASSKQTLLYFNTSGASPTAATSYVNIYDNIDFMKVINDYFELKGKLGIYNRVTNNLDIISLSDNYDPQSIPRSCQKSLEYDDEEFVPPGAVSVTYNNGTDDVYARLFFNGFSEESDPATYRTYHLGWNSIIRDNTFTAAQIDNILAAIADSLTGITYYPSNLQMVGRPDLDIGDFLELETADGSFNTIVLARALEGGINLTDKITCE